MAIVNTITSASEFEAEFIKYNRANNFSYDGLKVLFEYLDNFSDETGKNIELDVIALCCDYAESTVSEIFSSYDIEVDFDNLEEYQIDDAKRDAVRSYLEENTTVCGETDEGFVYACF